MAFLDAAALDLAFVEQLSTRVPGFLREAQAGSEAALWGTVKALENVYDAFEDLARRTETEFAAVPQGPEWHRDLLAGLARPRPGLRPPVLAADTVTTWNEHRAFRHFGRHRTYREPVAIDLLVPHVRGLQAAVRALRSDYDRFFAWVRAEIEQLEDVDAGRR